MVIVSIICLIHLHFDGIQYGLKPFASELKPFASEHSRIAVRFDGKLCYSKKNWWNFFVKETLMDISHSEKRLHRSGEFFTSVSF